MHTTPDPEYIIKLLEKCLKWKNDKSIKQSKVVLNIFIDFLRLRVVPKKNSAQDVFQQFINRPFKPKIEGKLETWIEVGLDGNPEIIEELNKKIRQIEDFGNNIGYTLPNKKDIEKKEITAFVQKTEHDDDDIFSDIKVKEEKHFETELNKPILVPWDFSPVADSALQHAVMFAPILGGTIYLLHIVKKAKEIEPTKAKLKKIAEEAFSKYKIKPEVLVKEGNIFKTITEIANDNRAKLVVMGTHGIKGIQKLTGSWALKVISGTNTPFVVVQNAPRAQKIENIVFPVDFTRENKQKLKQAKLLAKYYDINFILVVAKDISKTELLKKTKTNLNYVKAFFKQNNIRYEVKAVEGTESSTEAALKYAAENLPDLIMILTTKNLNLQDYMLGAEEQKIIANPQKIPVMVINPRKVIYASYGAFGNAV